MVISTSEGHHQRVRPRNSQIGRDSKPDTGSPHKPQPPHKSTKVNDGAQTLPVPTTPYPTKCREEKRYKRNTFLWIIIITIIIIIILLKGIHIFENLLNRGPRANFPFLPANAPKVCQLLNLACQHAKRTGVPIFQLRLPEGVPVFQLFFNFSIFELFLIANFKAIWAILENSSRLTKNLNFEHLQNFIKEKPCHPKIFDIVFNRARGINRTIIPLV